MFPSSSPPGPPPSGSPWEDWAVYLLERLDLALTRVGLNSTRLHWRLHQWQQQLIEQRMARGRPQPPPPPTLCPSCGRVAGAALTRCPWCDHALKGPASWWARLTRPGQGHEEGTGATRRILLVIFVMYFLTTATAIKAEGLSGLLNPGGRVLLSWGSLFGPMVMLGEPWRFVTAMFLHGGLIHLWFNSSALSTLGTWTEDIYGRHRMVVLFFFTGLTGWAGTWIWNVGFHPPWLDPTLSAVQATAAVERSMSVHSVGASGALYGLLGALYVFSKNSSHSKAAVLHAIVRQWILMGVVLAVAVGMGMMGRIDNAAHAGGLLGGALFAWAVGDPYGRGAPGWVWRLGAGLCWLLLVASLGLMLLSLLGSEAGAG